MSRRTWICSQNDRGMKMFSIQYTKKSEWILLYDTILCTCCWKCFIAFCPQQKVYFSYPFGFISFSIYICQHMLGLVFYPSSCNSVLHLTLCGRLCLSLSSPLSLHHHSLPPSGVTARWLQVAREGGRKGWREVWRTRDVCYHLFLCSYHCNTELCTVKLSIDR